MTGSVSVTIGTVAISGGSISIITSLTVNRSYTSSTTTSIDISQTYTNSCAAGYICTGQASAYEGTYSIPYTATVYYSGTSAVSTLTGTYKGTTLYDINYAQNDVHAWQKLYIHKLFNIFSLYKKGKYFKYLALIISLSYFLSSL